MRELVWVRDKAQGPSTTGKQQAKMEPAGAKGDAFRLGRRFSIPTLINLVLGCRV